MFVGDGLTNDHALAIVVWQTSARFEAVAGGGGSPQGLNSRTWLCDQKIAK
jgi:hypothetical protein